MRCLHVVQPTWRLAEYGFSFFFSKSGWCVRGCVRVRAIHADATVAANSPHSGCLQAESIQINVIIPEQSLIRVINVQRQQEVPPLLALHSAFRLPPPRPAPPRPPPPPLSG